MRKYQQLQILELFNTIREAQDAGLYAECQQGALTAGECIEAIKGEGTRTVKLLEEYCELLYQVSNGDLDSKALHKQNVKIENSIRTELRPNKIEVLFLPYQPSMWDSLESIYFAAQRDPDCDAFVVPMPYYELNPGGSIDFDRKYNNADKFPVNIPITHYSEYDIETRRPDIIFIHYPYDDNSSNFSVHPDYYSPNLRRHCEQLIYVPYFVVPGEAVAEYEAFLPGVAYAHHVIAQSQPVRQSYIKHFIKCDKEYEWHGCFGEAKDKFIALGSPKFDKVINSKKEDFELPEQWKMTIFKSDGSAKKIALLNTHMFRWMEGGEQYFRKLRYIFDTFKTRGDIVLWWRPHPNTEMNFRTKMPQYLKPYLEMVDYYKNENIGIYDDTPQLHRAIAWSDVYYGDPSSLTALFMAAKKPVLLQNVEDTGDALPLYFANITIDGPGKVWGFEFYHDGLFQLDFETDTAMYTARSSIIPQHMGKHYLRSLPRFYEIRVIDDYVICIPQYHDNILIYDRGRNETVTISLDCKYLLLPDLFRHNFTRVIRHHDRLYCFSGFVKAIVVFDISKHTVDYHTDIYINTGLTYSHIYDDRDYVTMPVYIKDQSATSSECSTSGRVILIMRCCPDLISYNLETQEVTVLVSNPVLAKCVLAEYDGRDYWLVAERYDKLVKWNPDDNHVKEYDIAKAGNSLPDKNCALTGMSECGDYLLLFPGFGNAVLRFDKQTERFDEYTKMPVPEDEQNVIWKYDRPKRIGDNVYAFARYNKTIYVLNLLTGTVTEHIIKLNEQCYEKFMGDYLNTYYSDESKKCADSAYPGINRHELDKLLRLLNPATHDEQMSQIKHGIERAELTLNPDGTAGEKIYQYVKEKII